MTGAAVYWSPTSMMMTLCAEFPDDGSMVRFSAAQQRAGSSTDGVLADGIAEDFHRVECHYHFISGALALADVSHRFQDGMRGGPASLAYCRGAAR